MILLILPLFDLPRGGRWCEAPDEGRPLYINPVKQRRHVHARDRAERAVLYSAFNSDLLFYERKAFRATVVGGGNGYAVGDAFCGTVEQTGRVARDGGIHREVGLGEFRGGFGIGLFAVIAFLIGGAFGAVRYRYILCAAAIAVVVFAVFLSAFKIVHNVYSFCVFCFIIIITPRVQNIR